MTFNNLREILKQVEIDIRSDNQLSRDTWEKLSNLDDWSLQIVHHFITEVNLRISQGDLNFVYKRYNVDEPTKNKPKYDLLIVCLKRDQRDLVLTDVINRLVIPQGISYKYLELYGMNVEAARNFAVQKSFEFGCNKLLFIDDDIVPENTSLVKLWETMKKYNSLAVGADYQKKAEYPVTAHGNFYDTEDKNIKRTDLLAMGFTLIDIFELSKKVPWPYFWTFAAPDGLWAMGEDAFFSKNMIEYTGEYPLVDLRPSILHYDKIWKKMFGTRNPDVTYATNTIDNFSTFDFMRQSPSHPIVNVCLPKRDENDLVATNFERVLNLRAYKTEFSSVFGLNVDQARNELASNSIKMGSRYTLFVDNDVILPENGLVQMIELMEEDDNIGMVVGDYRLKGDKTIHSAHLQLDNEGKATELNRINDLPEIIDANWLVGLGCALIRTEVFRQIRWPWFLCYSVKEKRVGISKEEDGGVNEDAHFTECLLNNGYNVKILRDLKCIHIDYQNGYAYGYDNEFDINKYACYDWINKFRYIGV